MCICCTGNGKSLIFEALPSGLKYRVQYSIRDSTEKDVSTTAVNVISPLIEYLEKVYTYV